MQAKRIYTDFEKKIVAHLEPREAENIAEMVFEHVFGLSKIDILLERDIDTSKIELLDKIAERLSENEPIQHILGVSDFFGRKYEVNEHTLIPRPETEELVALILDENKQGRLKLLDIGTGTGVIPISIKKERPGWEIHAYEVDKRTIQMAHRNANKWSADISLKEVDILTSEEQGGGYDIIVSNPPYIAEGEKAAMSRNVLDYEPHLALFVPDDNPLRFYRKISKFSLKNLNTKGRIYFEINENYGPEVLELLLSMNFSEVKISRDLNDKDRIVSGLL